VAERSQSYRTRAVILRRRNYGDADRILTVFTPRMGKRMLIAKGTRKTTSRQAGHLELFSHANLQVARARTWDIITESATVESFLQLRNDLDRIGRAAYVCELVDAFTAEEDDFEPVWELLLICLRELDSTSGDVTRLDLLLRWYELQLLRMMGFQPSLFACLGCGDDLLPVENFLQLDAGGVFCPSCGRTARGAEPINVATLRILRHLSRNQWESLRGLRIGRATALAAESVLQRYLVTILERRLKSTDFVYRLRQFPAEEASSGDPATPSAASGVNRRPLDSGNSDSGGDR